jgi:hypothetical protein
MSNKDATPAGKIDSQKVPMLYASSEKVLSDETATTLQILIVLIRASFGSSWVTPQRCPSCSEKGPAEGKFIYL